MSKGIVYVATSEIDGLIKIGRTHNLKKRMHELQTDGYKCQHCQIEFAIEVEEHEDKEELLHSIFRKCQVGDTEFFAEDIELVKQTMLAFEGTKVYPEEETQEEMFKEVTETINVKKGVIPVGIYTMNAQIQSTKEHCSGVMEITEDKQLILKAGAILGPLVETKPSKWGKARREAVVDNNKLMEDIICSSPSMAAGIVSGHSKNGWTTWVNTSGEYIDIYRQKALKESENDE